MAASASDAEEFYALAVLIPVYDHEAAIGHTLEQVIRFEYPILLVDDGSGEACRELLIELSQEHAERVSLLRLDINRGKGGAVKAGFAELLARGFTHAVQVDADGQHEVTDLPRFVAASQTNPQSLVTGCPQFDNVPKVRYYFRYLTHVWVWINTLSFALRDTMCGFRVYPLAGVCRMLTRERCGDRMDFDIEVLVRWCWNNGAVINLPTRVHYPIDGVSHFEGWRDNLLISWMHTRLFFGMLYRLPVILRRKFNV
ncbi:MAG TPA: glycosyltransferase family 2 protein [Pseudomonadales bacterium]|nr:glycosyltransferase family 2 protein [Pseudomonadales bacterium]